MPYELVSSITSSPYRCATILRTMLELGEPVQKAHLTQLFQPVATDRQALMKDPVDAKTAITRDCIRTLENLELVNSVGKDALEPKPGLTAENMLVLRDQIADHLLARDRTSPTTLETFYRWMLCHSSPETARRQSSTEELTDQYNREMSHGGDRLMNEEKYNNWRDWTVFLGLGWVEAGTTGKRLTFHPNPLNLVRRFLPSLFGNSAGTLEVGAVLERLNQQYPLLDWSTTFNKSTAAPKMTAGARINLAMSQTIRDLHDDGQIELRLVADHPRSVNLAHDSTHAFPRLVSTMEWKAK